MSLNKTSEVLSEEYYTALWGDDYVDFGALLTTLRQKHVEWHGLEGANNRESDFCQVLLISGGLIFEIGLDYINEAALLSGDPHVTMDFVAKWKHDGSELSGHEAEGPHSIDVPRILTCETVLIESPYGRSQLEGIAIKYPDEVPIEDRLFS